MTEIGSGVTTDPRMLEGADEGMSVYVRTSPAGQARRALEAATDRLCLVTMDGREYRDAATLEAEVVRTQGLAWENENASYIFDVVETTDGAYVLMDTSGSTPEMSSTVARIVDEELRRLGVGDAHIRRVEWSDLRTS